MSSYRAGFKISASRGSGAEPFALHALLTTDHSAINPGIPFSSRNIKVVGRRADDRRCTLVDRAMVSALRRGSSGPRCVESRATMAIARSSTDRSEDRPRPACERRWTTQRLANPGRPNALWSAFRRTGTAMSKARQPTGCWPLYWDHPRRARPISWPTGRAATRAWLGTDSNR